VNQASDFTLMDQDNKPHSLVDYTGKWLVLYFYPKDDTPGCTKEACAFRDGRDLLEAAGAKVVGVSQDSVASHFAFADKYQLNFTLLSDDSASTAKSYGVLNGMGGNKRMTFLIDPHSRIAKIYPDVSPADHGSQVLADLRKLR
jgi:peroxiredoxin Q/BCP